MTRLEVATKIFAMLYPIMYGQVDGRDKKGNVITYRADYIIKKSVKLADALIKQVKETEPKMEEPHSYGTLKNDFNGKGWVEDK